MNNRQIASVELKNGRFRLLKSGRVEDLNPKALLLYSTAQCAGYTIMALLDRDHILPKRVEITVEGWLDTPRLQASSRFQSFKIIYNIECSSLSEQNAASLAVREAQGGLCGMVAMIGKIAPVSHDILIESTEAAKV